MILNENVTKTCFGMVKFIYKKTSKNDNVVEVRSVHIFGVQFQEKSQARPKGIRDSFLSVWGGARQ